MTYRIAILGIKGLPARGGAERVVESVLENFPSEKIKFYVYGDNNYTEKSGIPKNVEIIPITTLKGKWAKPLSLFFFSAIHSLFKEKFNLVHVNNVEAGHIIPLIRLKYKVISTAHGCGYDRPDKWNRIERFLIKLNEIPFVKFSNCVTSVQRSLCEYYNKKYNIKTNFIPNGVDINPFIEDIWVHDFLKNKRIKRNNYILFVAGRIIPTKGAHLLLKAIDMLKVNTDVLLVGEMGHIQKYDTLLRNMANSKVHFLPLIKEKSRVLGIMKYCKFLVFPSTVEAMSMVLLEAASLGTPVICSDIQENIDVMDEHALYFSNNNAADLAQKIKFTIENPKEIKKMAIKAKEHVASKYSWKKISLDYFKIYKKLGIFERHIKC